MNLKIVTDENFGDKFEKDTVYVLSDIRNIENAVKRNVPVVIYAKYGFEKYPIIKKTAIVENLDDITIEYLQKFYNRFYGISNVIIKTEHLIIREQTVEDVEELYNVYANPSITEYMEGLYENHDEERAFIEKYIENMYGFYDYGLWILEDRKTGRIIGRAGLSHRMIDDVERTELGYVIMKEYQGRGLAYEAGLAIIDYAKNVLKKEELFVCTDTNNLPSLNLAKKLGFFLYATIEEENITLLECKL